MYLNICRDLLLQLPAFIAATATATPRGTLGSGLFHRLPSYRPYSPASPSHTPLHPLSSLSIPLSTPPSHLSPSRF